MVPYLETERLLLQPLCQSDAPQIQKTFPRWEIVRYLVASIPWPYPADGAQKFLSEVALPAMEAQQAWIWSLRLKSAPDKLIGIIGLYDKEDNHRGFWLAPEYQHQGLMAEACECANAYWFTELNRPLLRVEKATVNARSEVISKAQHMRKIKSYTQNYVGGVFATSLWELTREEWLSYHLPSE
ncbi:GNAT family N-acetyltransferase [Mangrovibacter yixingensis]|uniref:GNAT family N-acetyltransferase n=1 Tax=Mangrovibacter yixingensis TaxID=1529639 RepID=UPI001CFBE77E|nr:GNAT family N-acetyltransferase [Mangrovibacter yixingensis]